MNQHSLKIQSKIIELKNKGKSSRYIADLLNVSKSSVNYTYNRYHKKLNNQPNAKFVFIDIETSPDIAVTFKRFKANLSQDNILREGGVILSISWRWMHSTVTQGLALSSEEAKIGDDSRLCAVLYALAETADVMIGHNIDRLAPHSKLPVNSAIFTKDTAVICPVCNSKDIGKTGNSVYTPACEYEEYECNNCGSRHRSKTAVNTKEKRRSLLV